ncbi:MULTISPECIES: hypothetical protein [Streptomyces]|uniref:Uncharacterized protein n=1 Tax=Streptomyces albireticuli TaxID=1940 RepID=A0A1Z2KWV7_9ACTN|nr:MULTISPECIES: hypothetical protein [Streptomyces]ARZ66527.1 hypothetical protein SMD11_0861 [Streptomyces albireticuli]
MRRFVAVVLGVAAWFGVCASPTAGHDQPFPASAAEGSEAAALPR